MARPPKDHKTNALRRAGRGGIPHEELFFDAEPTMTGEEIARSQGEDPDAVFKTLVTQGKSGGYYVFLVPVAAELDLKKAAAAAGREGHRYDQGPRASAAHRLRARRLLAHRHEEALSHLRG